MAKGFTGVTDKTSKNLLLDSGAFFINYDITTDTYATAKAAGKLLGATRGGGSFTAVPEVRNIEVDGLAGASKGFTVIDSWEVRIGANVIEVTAKILQTALAAAKNSYDIDSDSDKITGKGTIELTDYINNVTFVGKRLGFDAPMIIQVFNALNTNGLSLTTSDKGESVIALDFQGHYDVVGDDTPPFAIYIPSDYDFS